MIQSSKPEHLSLLLVIMGLLGCSSEPEDWLAAQESATVEAYETYLAAHANGEHAEEATSLRNGLIDDAAWDEARKGNTVQAYDAYLEASSNGIHALEAQVRRAGLDYQYVNVRMALKPPEGKTVATPFLGPIESYPDGTTLKVTVKSPVRGEEVETSMEATYVGMDSDHGKFTTPDGACLLVGPMASTVKPCPDYKPPLPDGADRSAVLRYTWIVDFN